MGIDYKSKKCYAHILYILALKEPNQKVQYAAVCETRSRNVTIP